MCYHTLVFVCSLYETKDKRSVPSGGAILLVVSAVIILLTLMQHTHGQGLAGAINGGVGGANNARLTPADQMLAKVTRIAGIVFFVVAILACVFASRLA